MPVCKFLHSLSIERSKSKRPVLSLGRVVSGMNAIAWILIILAEMRVTGMAVALEIKRAEFILKNITSNYNSHVVPTQGGQAVEVKMKFYVEDMVPADSSHQTFTMSITSYLSWRDYRLDFTNVVYEGTLPSPSSHLAFDSRVEKHLWTPGLAYSGQKSGEVFSVLSEDKAITIFPNGTLNFRVRMRLTFHCPMELKFFPFDIQYCSFNTRSFVHSRQYLKMAWDEDKGDTIIREEKLHMNSFERIDFSYEKEIIVKANSGNYSSIGLAITLHRYTTLFIVQHFIPCISIVALSWITFWIDFRSTPARVILGILTILTIVTLTNAVKAIAPPTAHFRSMDWYLTLCNTYVIMAVAEYALVGMTEPRYTRYFNVKQVGLLTQISPADNVEEKSHFIDNICKLLFPISFALSNGVYFVIHFYHPETTGNR